VYRQRVGAVIHAYHRRVRLRVAGAVGFVFAVVVYVCGVLMDSPSLMAQGALGALGVAMVYVVLGGRGAPSGLRWALVGCLAAVAATVGAETYWTSQPSDVGYFAYAPAGQARAALDALLDESVVRQRWLALGLLGAAGFAVVAVRQLPERHDEPRPRHWWLVAVGAGFGLPLAYLALDAWQTVTFRIALGQGVAGAVADVAAAIWLPVTAAVVALAAGVLAVRRDAAWPATVGVFLFAVSAVYAAGNLASSMPLPRKPNVVAPGLLYESSSVALSVSVVDLTWAAFAAALIVAPVLVAAGCLRSRQGRSQPDPPASTDPVP
jgi:hypothetical protein